jgi:hypothetical protein
MVIFIKPNTQQNMRKFLLVALLATCLVNVKAQDSNLKEIQATAAKEIKAADPNKKGWQKGGLFSLNLAQGGSRNWAAGAEKFSFSTAAFLNLFANKQWGKHSWANSFDFSYAMVNTTSQGVRKTDDRIDLLSRYGYALKPKLDLSGLVNFRTQFTDGFNYDYRGKGLQKRISGLFAPAYLTIAPGVTWKPTSYFSVFVSPVSARWIIVTNNPYSYYFQGGVDPSDGFVETPLAQTYGVNPRQQVTAQVGGFISANFKKEIFKNVTYQSRLDLYSNYLKAAVPGKPTASKEAHPEKVDVFWTNVIAMKVNKWLNVTYNFDVIYDDDIRQFGPKKTSPATQMRSLLGVGFSAKF